MNTTLLYEAVAAAATMPIENQNDDEFLRDLLRQIIEAEGFTDKPKINIKAGSEAGEGYIGITTAVEIESESKSLKLFVKSATKNEKERSQIFTEGLFGREIFFYDAVYPELIKFQLERNVKHPFSNVPKCYLTTMENLNETLIFENLKEQGYVLYDKKVDMNEQHILYMLKLYARFHAVSYAMKDQNFELYEKLCENLKDFSTNIFETSGFDQALSYYCEEAKKLFDSAEDSYVSNRIKNLTEILLDSASNPHQFADEYSVITHGDCWCNNFLFKYKDSNDPITPEDVKVLDWQVARMNSPVLDLSYFFYSVATKMSLDRLDFYMKTYHDKLLESIKEMGSDPEKLYPYHVFRYHWKRVSRFGLAIALFIRKIMLTEKEEVPNTAETVNSGKKFGTAFVNSIGKDELYKIQIREIVEHFVYNNFI